MTFLLPLLKTTRVMVAVENVAEYLLEQLKTHDVVQVPASEAEYLDTAPEFPGKLEYHNGEIIAKSLAKLWHEVLVNGLGFLLEQHFRNRPFLVVNSNAGLQIPAKETVYYQPDLMVIRQPPVFKEGSEAIITNPYLVVEALSKSTGKYNKEDKLPGYKEVGSLQYIVHVAQDRPYMTVYERTDQPDVWLNTDYKTLDSVATLGDLTLPLREVYHKIQFPQT